MSCSALRNRSRDAVFLCYHSVAENGPPYLSLRPEILKEQLRILSDDGYRSGGRADLDALAAGGRPESPLVFLSFDDGFLDTATTALPALSEHGFTAAAFLLAGHLDQGDALDWPEVATEAARRPQLMKSMDWQMADRLAEAGWDIGSHGINHARMPKLTDEELAEELLESRRRLAERYGDCDTLAYPFGDWDTRVAAAAAAAGYEFAFSLPYGAQPKATRLSIPRVMVDDRDSSLRFRAKLSRVGRRALFSPLRPIVRTALQRKRHSHGE